MLKFGKIWSLFALLFMVACSHSYKYDFINPSHYRSCKTQRVKPVVKPKPVVQRADVTLSGLRYCPNARRCSDEALLPPQPCLQPMPTYYDDVPEPEFADGVLLIHPITRVKVICYERDGADAVACAERFRAQGYVLITDVPQFAGKYDFLQDGSYPSRRWRHGEIVPRW